MEKPHKAERKVINRPNSIVLHIPQNVEGGLHEEWSEQGEKGVGRGSHVKTR
jgi:hypothetical protein